MRNIQTQSSKLLPALFQSIDAEQSLTVFHVGAALSETVDFFSSYRCKLHFIDLFSELPIVAPDKDEGEDTGRLRGQFTELLHLPADTMFDLCLFWDIFNHLDSESIAAFLGVLHPHLKPGCQAHAFSMHNRKAPQGNHVYGIKQLDTLTVRSRRSPAPGYAPHSQRTLGGLLHCFRLERSVLLPDSRLEMLLQFVP